MSIRYFVMSILILLWSLSFIGISAGESTEDPIENFSKSIGLEIKKSFSNKNFAKDPASLQWVSPKDGKSSYAIDLGIGLKLPQDAKRVQLWSIKPSIEYHKQTQGSSPQDTLKAGVNIDAQFYSNEALSHFTHAAIEYKNDRKLTGQGFAVAMGYSLTYNEMHVGITGPGNFQYMFEPWIVVQAEQANGLGQDKGWGSIYRIKPSVKMSFYPWGELLQKRVELMTSYQLWANLSKSGPYNDYSNYQSLYAATVNYYFDWKRRFGIGFDYTVGENPENGRKKQTLTSLSLKVGLGI